MKVVGRLSEGDAACQFDLNKALSEPYVSQTLPTCDTKVSPFKSSSEV